MCWTWAVCTVEKLRDHLTKLGCGAVGFTVTSTPYELI